MRGLGSGFGVARLLHATRAHRVRARLRLWARMLAAHAMTARAAGRRERPWRTLLNMKLPDPSVACSAIVLLESSVCSTLVYVV